MPVYVYQCDTCTAGYSEEQLGSMSEDDFESAVLFETFHAINPNPEDLQKALVCPRCGKTECQRKMLGYNVTSYIRGYGWRDKAGAKRDMHIYHLKNQDPYSSHRTTGEVDHIESNLKKLGKHDPKTKYFTTRSNGSSSDNNSK